MLKEDGVKLDKVVSLEVPDELLVDRYLFIIYLYIWSIVKVISLYISIAGRWIHKNSGRSYHLVSLWVYYNSYPSLPKVTLYIFLFLFIFLLFVLFICSKFRFCYINIYIYLYLMRVFSYLLICQYFICILELMFFGNIFIYRDNNILINIYLCIFYVYLVTG